MYLYYRNQYYFPTYVSNSHNVIKAAMKALMELESPADVAARRGMSVADVFKG